MAVQVARRPQLAPATIVHGWPPEWIRTFATVELGASLSTVFTYGDTIYVPSGQPLPADVVAHEDVHRRQQGDDPAGWWERYFVDVPWRLEQEVAAYRRQYAAYVARVPGRGLRAQFLDRIAGNLAGPVYGHLVEVSIARALITGERKD